jgi:tryptophan-rich sensory protein
MNRWYKSLNKAPWTPPSYVFGIVWPILYVLMGISFLLVWKNKKCFPYCSPLTYFLIQLGFNLIWTTLFFVMKKPLLALLDICLIIYFAIQTYNRFIKIDRLAAYLLVPYLLWLLIAFSMNFYIVLMN